MLIVFLPRRAMRHFRAELVCRSLPGVPLPYRTIRICPLAVYNHNDVIECQDRHVCRGSLAWKFSGSRPVRIQCLQHEASIRKLRDRMLVVLNLLSCQRPALFDVLRPELANPISQILFSVTQGFRSILLLLGTH